MATEPLSQRFERMRAACSGQTVTLRRLLSDIGPRDHALVALLVADCSIHPVPMPGLSISLALLAATAGARMALGLPLGAPRISVLPWAARAHGAAIALCGAMLMIPLPPPTNMPPAASLLLLSLGVLESDALVLALGYGATAASASFFTWIACLGWSGARALAGL